MSILIVDNLSKSFGATLIFRSISFTVGQGEKVCVIGRNGEGKTTLLRVIAGELEQDEGAFQLVGRRTLGYLSQDVPVFSGSVLEEMLSSRRDILDLGQKMKDLEEKMAAPATEGDTLEDVMNAYARATARFETLGGYTLESRAKSILSGLGFSAGDFDKDPNVLSGGERIRLALAKLLLQEPDLLLLDEPTNHLDLGGIEWLEGFLTSYPGAVLIVSHDRYFMDKVAQKTLALDRGEGKVYAGNYSAYLKQKELEDQVQSGAYERQQELIARTKAFIQKWKATPTRKNQAWSRQKMLDRMELVEKPKHERKAMGLRFDLEQESGDEVALIRDLARGFDVPAEGRERVLFRDFTWLVRRGDRVALIGPNGCGKTTMLRCILGLDNGYTGTVQIGQNVVTGYFSQALDGMNDAGTVLEEARGLGLDNQEARDLLGRFLFSGEDVDKKVAMLSGGERNMLALAKMVVGKANVLFLDEPTNHLDMAAREVLERSVRDFPGTLIFASHDRFFIDRLATHLWLFEGGRVRVFKGTYSEYRRKVEAGEQMIFEDELPSYSILVGKNAGAAGPVQDAKRDAGPQSERRSKPAPRGGQAAASRPRQRVAKAPFGATAGASEIETDLAKVEGEIQALEERRDELVRLLNDPGSYAGSPMEALKEYAEVERSLASLYERWEAMASHAVGGEESGEKEQPV